MNKFSSLLLILVAYLMIGTTPVVYAEDKKDGTIEKPITLNDILGPLKEEYVSQDDYKKVKSNLYKTRLLSDYEPGLAKGIWNGSSAKDIIEQLNAFEGVNGSPALRDLWRTALLEGFNGVSFGSKKHQKNIDLTIARINAMIKLGLFHDVIRLYHAFDKHPIPTVIADKAIEAMALAGMVDGACLEVKFVTQSVRTTDWLKKRALCAAHQNDKKLEKQLNVFIGDDLKDDSIHQSVARLLKKSRVNGPVKSSLSPFHRGLLLANGGTISQKSLNKADGSVLASAVISPYLPFGKRLAAADKAADLATISPQNLLAIYEKVNLSDGQINNARTALLNGRKVSGAKALSVVTNTHDPELRAKLINKVIHQTPYVTNTKNQLLLKYIDKISSQSGAVPSFAPTAYSLAVWQDYLAASQSFKGKVEDTLSILSNVSDLKMPEQAQVDNVLAFIEKEHPKTANIRKQRVLAALKALKFVEDSKIDSETLKKWRENKKSKNKKGIIFLNGLNALSVEKPGLTSPLMIYQTLEKYNKNQFFEENRKITLEIIVQSVL